MNDIQLVQDWLDRGSSLFYVFFSGAISDHFGRKPIILFPLFGILVTAVSQIINYAYLESLPVEFFYLENISGFFGGYSMYYLGLYAFGASFAVHPDDRYIVFLVMLHFGT